jgi:hypothetical protein
MILDDDLRTMFLLFSFCVSHGIRYHLALHFGRDLHSLHVTLLGTGENTNIIRRSADAFGMILPSFNRTACREGAMRQRTLWHSRILHGQARFTKAASDIGLRSTLHPSIHCLLSPSLV